MRAVVAAIVLYPFFVDDGDGDDDDDGQLFSTSISEWGQVEWLVLISFVSAVVYSPAGAACGVVYAAVGQTAFDTARRTTFSPERYPLLQRLRPQHAATAEKRALQAAEYTKD